MLKVGDFPRGIFRRSFFPAIFPYYFAPILIIESNAARSPAAEKLNAAPKGLFPRLVFLERFFTPSPPYCRR
jgi:hypothetical protein